jgi:CheY-like chemotaxis protein
MSRSTPETKRILLVDDDESLRELAERLLSPPYEVAHAANGREALRAIATRPPHLVVLDLRMPVMDGWQLVERLEQEGRQVDIVLLSGEEARPWPESPLVKARIEKRLMMVALREACSRLLTAD